jgi:hypothetical protein
MKEKVTREERSCDVFYMVRGRDFDMSGAKGSLLDIAPLAARRPGLIGVGERVK